MKFVKQILLPLLFLAACAAALCDSPNYVAAETEEEPVLTATTETEEEPEQTAAAEAETVAPPVQQEYQTLLDEEGILVQYCGIDLNGDPTLLLYIENHREEPISYYLDDFALNGYAISIGNKGDDIAPGQSYDTAEHGQSFDLEDLGYYGVTSIEDISFLFEVHVDREGPYYATIVEKEMHIHLEEPVQVHVEPIGEPSEQIVLVDSEDAYIEFCGIDTSSEYNWRIDLYVENRSNTSQWWSLKDVRINDCYTMIWNDPQPISAGLKYRTPAKHEAVFDYDDLMRYGVDKITKLDFTLVDLDSGDYTGTEVHIDGLDVPIPSGEEEEEHPAKKQIYTGNGLTVSFCGFHSVVYSDNYTHDYFLSLQAETGKNNSASIAVSNFRIDGVAVPMTGSDMHVPRDCVYRSDANWKLDFRWDAWDAAGNMEFEKVEFDMILEYKDTQKTIPVCIYSAEQA